jgi:hypothetical protein
MNAAQVASSKVCILVVGIGLDAVVADPDAVDGQILDALPCGRRHRYISLGRQEGIVRIVRGVEQVLVV